MPCFTWYIRPKPAFYKGITQLQGYGYSTFFGGTKVVNGISSKSTLPTSMRPLLKKSFSKNRIMHCSLFSVRVTSEDINQVSKCMYQKQKRVFSNLYLSQQTSRMSTDSYKVFAKKGEDEKDVSKHEDVKKWVSELSKDFGFPSESVGQNIMPSDSESDSDDEKIIIVPKPVRPGEEPMDPDEIDKQMQRYDYEEFEMDYEEEKIEEENVKQHPCSLERGSTGVFDIEELVAVLEGDNAGDLCVIRVPPEKKYVDYMVLGTGKSTRQLRAMSAYIQWLYKKKRGEKDPLTIKIEGEDTKDWMAMDLGNIAVHLFLQSTREKYDLETLWTVGPEFDDKVREEDGLSLQNDDFDWASLIMEEPSKSRHTND